MLRTQSGQVWLLRALYGVVFVLLVRSFVGRRKGSRALLLLSLPLAASRSLSGHAVAVRDNTLLVVASDSIHLIATACWAGGLPFLLYLLVSEFRTAKHYPALTAAAMKQFSRLAFASVAILLATGVYQSWTHVGRFDALRSTTYGNVLALKLVIFACMLVLGAINFYSTKPMFVRATLSTLPQSFPKIALRRVGAESVLGVSILGLSGFLTTLAAGGSQRSHQAAGRECRIPGEPRTQRIPWPLFYCSHAI